MLDECFCLGYVWKYERYLVRIRVEVNYIYGIWWCVLEARMFELGLFTINWEMFLDLWLGISLYFLAIACYLNLGTNRGILDDRISQDMFVSVIAVNPQKTKLLLLGTLRGLKAYSMCSMLSCSLWKWLS